MLLNNFFYIDQVIADESSIKADIRVNSNHPILMGHFPEQPIVPGVCMLEMLKEVIQFNYNKKYQLESASMIKFLTMFAPPQFTSASFNIQINPFESNKLQVNASLNSDDTIFLKFKGVFIEK
jgi:3-hydroxyacyl-[acyl-carrier-protein] dehydratase